MATQQTQQRAQQPQQQRSSGAMVQQPEQPAKQAGAMVLLNQPARRAEIGRLLVGDFGGPDGEKRRETQIDRIIRIVGLEMAKPRSRLPECDPWSIVSSVQEATRLGLEIGGALGHAYLVPYKGTCQLQVGYRGLIELALRSGKVKDVQAHVVYRGDLFRFVLGDEPRIEHERQEQPTVGTGAAPWTHVYCVVRLTNGGMLREMMTRAEVMRIKARSPSASAAGGPWVSDETEMARKTVVKRTLKYAPMSVEVAELIEREEAIETTATEVHEVPRGNAGLAHLARAQLGPVETPEDEREQEREPGGDDGEPPPSSDEPLIGADGKPI